MMMMKRFIGILFHRKSVYIFVLYRYSPKLSGIDIKGKLSCSKTYSMDFKVVKTIMRCRVDRENVIFTLYIIQVDISVDI